jgi:predicted dehydrogenase
LPGEMGMNNANKENGGLLRGAIVGFGNAALHAHLPAWQASAGFTIEAVVEPNSEQADKARRFLPEVPVYGAFEDLLGNGELDFIDVCTPPCFHVDLVAAACRSGLHVFCEKPLTVSSASLREIERAAATHKRVVFTVNNWKYAPLWLKIRELIDDDRIGSIRSVSLNVLRPPNSGGGASDWRKCLELAWGGILIDHGWHNLYVILSLIGKPPLSVAAQMYPAGAVGSCCEETVDLTVNFADVEAHLHLTWLADCRRNFGTIIGEKGEILINDDHLVLRRADREPVQFHFSEALSAGSHHPEWMNPVVDNFRQEINNVQDRGKNLLEARWCAQLIELGYRSSREHSRPLRVPTPAGGSWASV